jgi:hypothetical protein
MLVVGVRGFGSVLAVALVAVLACWAPGAAAKSGPPVLAFSPSPFDYGSVTSGQMASQIFTLKNTGGSATSALHVGLSGASAFTLTSDSCSATSLGPGKSCTVTVQFAPTSTGGVAASLSAASNKPAAHATDSLTGTGASAAHLLYWANLAGGTIVGAGLDGSNPQTIATGQNFPAGVAVDSSHLYWANAGGGTIVEAGLDGSSPQTIATGQNDPVGVAAVSP